MYSSFLTMCGGVFSDGLLTVYAPDEVTLGRLDNDRVRSILGEELEKLAAAPEPVRVKRASSSERKRFFIKTSFCPVKIHRFALAFLISGKPL